MYRYAYVYRELLHISCLRHSHAKSLYIDFSKYLKYILLFIFSLTLRTCYVSCKDKNLEHEFFNTMCTTTLLWEELDELTSSVHAPLKATFINKHKSNSTERQSADGQRVFGNLLHTWTNKKWVCLYSGAKEMNTKKIRSK